VDECGGDSEPDVVPAAGVDDADDVAVQRDERAAAVAGVDGGVGLDGVRDGEPVRRGERPVDAADDARRDGPRVAEGFPIATTSVPTDGSASTSESGSPRPDGLESPGPPDRCRRRWRRRTPSASPCLRIAGRRRRCPRPRVRSSRGGSRRTRTRSLCGLPVSGVDGDAGDGRGDGLVDVGVSALWRGTGVIDLRLSGGCGGFVRRLARVLRSPVDPIELQPARIAVAPVATDPRNARRDWGGFTAAVFGANRINPSRPVPSRPVPSRGQSTRWSFTNGVPWRIEDDLQENGGASPPRISSFPGFGVRWR